MTEKARYSIVTDPAEIDAIRREHESGDIALPIGGEFAGTFYALPWSLERYREARRKADTAGAAP